MRSPTSHREEQNFKEGDMVTHERQPANLAIDPIRAELNIEKWPALWRPAHSPKAASVRILERDQSLKNGGRVRARVEVGFSHLGELTTEDQKTYYALVKHWEEGGRSAQQTYFSLRALARSLHKRWGTNVITSLTDSLRRLRATPVSWMNAYFDSGHQDTIEEIDTFNILTELKIVRRKVDGKVTREAGYFRFNDFTLTNLLANHTKPVLFETILGFRSELAQLIYAHLDLILADKRMYERRSKELFRDLGLTGTEYERVYERKRSLTRALDELRGALLTTGAIASIAIGKTKDGTDFKITVTKGAGTGRLLSPAPLKRGEAPVGERPLTQTTPEAEELVKHFYKHFHNLDRVYPQAKELNQATALTAQHGFDRAKYIVNYAQLAAARTGYLPQTFGGILQYTSRAVADYEAALARTRATASRKEAERARESFEHLQLKIAERKHREAERRLNSLSPDEYHTLYERMKGNIKNRSAWLRGQSEESAAFKRAVRSAMIAALISSSES